MIIPATHTEIEQIYLAAEMNGCRSLCITACQSGDGVTSIVTALAERYLFAGHKTLVVDLNTFHPAFEGVEFSNSKPQEQIGTLISHSDTHQLFTGLTIPTNQAALLEYKDPSCLAKSVNLWLNDFDRVIFDTSPLLHINRGNIPAQVVASACDQTALVVLGGKTSTSQLEQAVSLLKSDSISLLGSVLNMKEQSTLAQEMVRELERFKVIPQSWRNSIAKRILTNEFLAQSA
ncbi:chromosome partitioning protein ParA [Vibrio sp. TBV020]|uniref:chromosome partitioning protein ParA n=1 Tax=Vibrio sp. TBV020 TaxID=3137398 RepID=UPI0038CD8BAD